MSIKFAASRIRPTLAASWILMVCALAGCTWIAPSNTPWEIARSVDDVLPGAGPALVIDRGAVIAAWAGAPSMPNIRVFDLASPGEPVPVALGIRPGQLGLYRLADGWYQLLWLDQQLATYSELVGGTLGPGRDVRRGPTQITRRPTLEFSAVTTPQGDLNAFWVERSGQATPVFTALIDRLGRPHQPVLLAELGRHPAGAYDRNGDLHVIWLEPGAGRLWTVRYIRFPGGQIDAARIRETAQSIGVIRLEDSAALESLALAVDGTHVYCLWSIVTVGGAGVRGTPGGLVFPLANPTSTRNLKIEAESLPNLPENLSLRWPSMTGGTTVYVSFSASAGEAWRDRPLLIALSPEGVVSAQQVTEGENGLLERTAIGIDDQGVLHLVWLVMGESGRGTLRYATAPALQRR